MKQELVPDSLLDALKAYGITLVQASRAIRKEGATKYPIFVVTQETPKAGVPLIVGANYKKEWNVNASSLEEFYVKKIMTKEATEQFRKIYKDPEKFFCVFMVSFDEVKMLYIPIDKQFIHQS